MDLIRALLDFNAGRDPKRLAMKFVAMRASPFAFLRGSCHLFYSRPLNASVLRTAPAVWACGDLHLQNFGSYKGDSRLVYFDINDFDESALAPASWDVLRLLTSLLVADAGLGTLTAPQVQGLCRSLIEAYAGALAQGRADRIERDAASGPIGDLLAGLRERKRKDWLDRRTVLKGKRRRIVCDDKHASTASAADVERATALIDGFAATQAEPGFFEVVDVAQRIAGTGSLGIERYAVLVRGKGSPDDNYFLDLKRASASALAPALAMLPLAQPAWPTQAQRIVETQRRMQAVPAAFLHPLTQADRAYVLRGLEPTEDRVALDGLPFDALRGLVQDLGRLLAWAQLRSSGRQGSAVADALIAFGADGKTWITALLAAASEAAQEVRRDWAAYCVAFDADAFRQTP